MMRKAMTNKLPDMETSQRVTRELERERHERALHDEQRAGLAVDEEFRLKDARENFGSANLRRPSGR
jgi:hypothetical protein